VGARGEARVNSGGVCLLQCCPTSLATVDATCRTRALSPRLIGGCKQVRQSEFDDSLGSFMRGISSSYTSSTCTPGNVLRNCAAR
jgi:hypothetical protein